MDLFLLIAVGVLALLILALNIYIVLYYAHTKDTVAGSSWLLRAVCVSPTSHNIAGYRPHPGLFPGAPGPP